MIRVPRGLRGGDAGKPRASGDDPSYDGLADSLNK